MNLSKKVLALSAMTLILAVTLSGCINVGATTGLKLLLTDPTATELDELWVKIVSIEVYPGVGEGGAIEVFSGELIVDLLDTVFPTTVLVVEDFELPPGDYHHFKLYLGEIDNDDVPGYDDVPGGFEALAVDSDPGPVEWFMCVVPPGKFNVNVYDQDTMESSFTKVEGEAIELTIDFQWNGNMAKNEDNNLNPTGTAYVDLEVLPNIIVSKTGPLEVTNGEEAIYTITVEVHAVSTNINVTDTIPTDWDYDEAAPDNSPTVDGDDYMWEIGDLDPEGTSTYTMELTLIAHTSGECTNTVSVICTEGWESEATVDITVVVPT